MLGLLVRKKGKALKRTLCGQNFSFKFPKRRSIITMVGFVGLVGNIATRLQPLQNISIFVAIVDCREPLFQSLPCSRRSASCLF